MYTMHNSFIAMIMHCGFKKFLGIPQAKNLDDVAIGMNHSQSSREDMH